jgi:hypothetical protein
MLDIEVHYYDLLVSVSSFKSVNICFIYLGTLILCTYILIIAFTVELSVLSYNDLLLSLVAIYVLMSILS